MPARPAPRPPRLHVVTGKGGTGKTTVAAALALTLAKGGARVLVVEVEGRGGLAAAFGLTEAKGEQLAVSTEGGGEVYVLDVDPRAALLQYLRLKVPVPAAAGVLSAVGAVDFATTVAPGVRDVIALGKVYEAARRERTSRPGPRYDAVVLDAPPTGRVGRFLAAPRQVAEMAQAGPIGSQALRIEDWLRESTVIHLVALLEELPVEETCEAVAELAEDGWSVSDVVVNDDEPAALAAGVVATLAGPDAAADLAAELSACGLDVTPTTARTLVDHLRQRTARDEERHALRDRLATTGLPLAPLRPGHGPEGRPDLDALAAQLSQVGVLP